MIPWQKSIGSDRAGAALLLGLILLTMLTFTLPALIKDLPYRLETDEEDWVPPAVRMAAYGTANPGWFGHPGATVLYPLGAIYQLVYDPTFTRDEMIWEHFKESPADFIWIGRVLSLVYAFAALPLVFLIGRRFGGNRIGLLGTWLFILAPAPLYYATIIRSDSAATFFALLTLLLCMDYAKKPTIAGALCMGAGAALAIATRFFMAALLPAILVTILSTHGWRSIRNWLPHGIAAGAAAVLIFALVSPFVLLDSATMLTDLRHEARVKNLGSDGLNPLGNILWHLTTAIPDNLTWPTAIIALGGLCLMARIPDRRALPLLTFACVTLIGISIHPLHSYRWTIQILPVLTIAAALTLDTAIQRFNLPGRLALLTAALVLSMWPFTGDVVRTISMQRPSTLVQAREWLLLHVAPGERIADAVFLDPFQRSHLRSISHVSLLDFGSIDSLRRQGINYMVVDAWREKMMREQPQRYTEELAYFEDLEAHERLAASFVPSSFVRGFDIRVYDIREAR